MINISHFKIKKEMKILKGNIESRPNSNKKKANSEIWKTDSVRCKTI